MDSSMDYTIQISSLTRDTKSIFTRPSRNSPDHYASLTAASTITQAVLDEAEALTNPKLTLA